MKQDGQYLKGKRLLLLGGGTDMIKVVHLAKSIGCIVYVLDYYDTLRSPAKRVADYAVDISIFDTDIVVQYIKENRIDGVMTGYTDSYLMQYLDICERAGLPHYGSEQAFKIATDKMLFKQACIESNVRVIPGINAYDFETVKAFSYQCGFPLMLKPTDNSGSRGVIKCENDNTLKRCYEYALSYSKSKNVIVEKFMDCESVGIVYQLVGNHAVLAAVCDRDIYQAKEDGSSIVAGTRYPSKYLERYITEMDGSMKKMLLKNRFKDGMVSPMAFVDDNGFYMCEMCYRPSGGHHFTLINEENGVNGLELLIEFAVTGKIQNYDASKENPFFNDYCGMIHIMGIPNQKIAFYDGLNEIASLEGVIDYCQELHVGQVIGKDGTTAQEILSVWIKSKDEIEFDNIAQKVKRLLQVYDENGRTLVI